MLNAAKILFVGQIKLVLEDESADHLSCADKDAAFTLIASTADDILELEPAGPLPDKADKPRVRQRLRAAEITQHDLPVRLFFFCRDDTDGRWLQHACGGRPDGIGLAAIEVETGCREGTCYLRLADGVRTIPVIPAG